MDWMDHKGMRMLVSAVSLYWWWHYGDHWWSIFLYLVGVLGFAIVTIEWVVERAEILIERKEEEEE